MYHLTSKDVISLDINGHSITIIPAQKLISCNIEEAYGLHYSTSEGLVGWTPRWISGKEIPFYDYSSIEWLCKLRNKPIPKILQPYLYPLTKHDDLQENAIMTTNQLINIQQQTIGNDTVNAVSARELHKFLESKREFTHWVKPYVSENNDYGFIESIDFIAVDVGVNRISQQVMKDYWFTIDMAKEVSMLSKTEKGKQARKYFIECEKKATNPQPAELSRKDLLLIALKAEEDNENLQLELKSKEEQIEQDKSFTKLGKMMVMADGTVKIADYAIMLQNDHNLKIGQNRLFEWLREHGYLCKDEKQKNRPTQKAMELGLFAYTQRIITNNHGDELFKFTPRLTGKGQVYFIDKLIHDFSPTAA